MKVKVSSKDFPSVDISAIEEREDEPVNFTTPDMDAASQQ